MPKSKTQTAPPTITLPLAYVIGLEAAVDALSDLLEVGLSINNVENAHSMLHALDPLSVLLSPAQKAQLGIDY